MKLNLLLKLILSLSSIPEKEFDNKDITLDNLYTIRKKQK